MYGAISQPKMDTPPSTSCAFGPHCPSPTLYEKGRELCSWCKNLSFHRLYQLAASQPDKRFLNAAINNYMQELIADKEYYKSMNLDLVPCASKDPTFFNADWRSRFDPEDDSACTPVRKSQHEGRLCKRCYGKARIQGEPWLEELYGMTFGFPCVWDDEYLIWSGANNVNDEWKTASEDPYWKPSHRCWRLRHMNQLCQLCFNRTYDGIDFKYYFEPVNGFLRQPYGIPVREIRPWPPANPRKKKKGGMMIYHEKFVEEIAFHSILYIWKSSSLKESWGIFPITHALFDSTTLFW